MKAKNACDLDATEKQMYDNLGIEFFSVDATAA